MSILIQLERFEGPLALLLHLIRSQEMDIFDINIHQITQQYLDYIRAMKKLDLEVAGEFVAMAATLIHIKSRMLLPQYNDEGEEIVKEDPRRELVQKLLEYQKFQEVSQKLYERPLVGRDVWLRGQRLDLSKEKDEEILTEDNALFSLISAYRAAVRNMKKTVHRVGQAMQSIAGRILEMRDRLVVGQRIGFSQLIETKADRVSQVNHVLVTFLSLLELAKMGFISVFQSENFSEIHIDPKKEIDRDVVSRVEEFDSSAEQSSMKAAALIEEAMAVVEPGPEPEVDLNAESEEGDAQGQLLLGDGDEGVPEDTFEVEAATDDEILEEERRLAGMDSASGGVAMAADDFTLNEPPVDPAVMTEDGVS